MKRKNHFTRIFLVILTLLCMSSCVRDDLAAESQSQQNSKNMSAKFASRSFWKEDNVYINKVQQVFLKVANLEHVRTKYGELNWDYAMTFGNFNERYALVPIIKENKVVLLMEAVRTGNKVFFYEKDNKDLIEFFNLAIYSKITKFEEVINAKGNISSKSLAFSCSTRWLTVGCFDHEPDCVPYVKAVTNCEFQGGGIPPKGLDPIGMSDGGGDGGWEYPDPPEEEVHIDPCEKLKTQNTDVNFKNKVLELDKEEVFKKTKETGFAAAYGPQINYESLANTSNDNVKLPDGNKYFGYMHVHLNKEGVVKIFSPSDIFTFLTSCVRNAEEKGVMTDAYGMVITSQGNYILKYAGDGTYGLGPSTKATWQTWYATQYSNLTLSELSDPNVIEKIFTQFLKEIVNINGLEVYKADKSTGKTTKMEFNGKNNPVKLIPCN